jgi:hypothetical protein
VFVVAFCTTHAIHVFLEGTGQPLVGERYEPETLLQAIRPLAKVGLPAESER